VALHNYLRRVPAGGILATIAFNNGTLQTPIGVIGVQAASVLLRTVALYALTHREHADATVLGPIGPIATPEHLKLFSKYDCLFPFSNNGVSFPAPRNHDNIDLIIANNEFGVVMVPAVVGPPLVPAVLPTAADYINFIAAPAGNNNNQRGATVANGGTALGAAAAGALPVDDEDVSALDIHNLYNDYAINHAIIPALNPPMNFFDELNVVHYIHKLLARQNIRAVRELRGNAGARYNRTLKASIPNQGPSTTMHLQKGGNFEGTEVGSWGPYADDINNRDAFTLLRNVFRGINLINADEQELVRIFRDLYRLECIREPAALITNAMFVDLAMFNANNGYTSISNDVYDFPNIRDRMPMAPRGVVDATRRLWSLLITAHDAIGNNIYYRYDYTTLGGLGVIPAATRRVLDTLTRLENNLLFNYIMHQADQLDTVNPGAGNITARLRNDILLPPIPPAANQQLAFVGGVNPWELVAGTSATGAVPAPGAPAPIPVLVGGALPAGVAGIYQVTVPVTIAGANHNIVFQARFPNTGNPIQVTDIFITSFPLALMNQLLLDWYQVDIGLAAAPNQDIQIDLQLRA
jgi:hypothetical protein